VSKQQKREFFSLIKKGMNYNILGLDGLELGYPAYTHPLVGNAPRLCLAFQLLKLKQ
jgi:hypothetical protein